MSKVEAASTYFICDICSHLIEVPPHFHGALVCERCGFTNKRLKKKSALASFIFTLTALIFYIPANLFPFMSIEMYGNRNTSTVWGGIVSLAETGSWSIAIIVFIASVIVPFFKLLSLLYLSLTAHTKHNPYFKSALYRVIEAIGRWSMLDIFLLAVLVAMMKFGKLAHVEPGAGSYCFALVVIFTMLASANFDPQLLWRDNNEPI